MLLSINSHIGLAQNADSRASLGNNSESIGSDGPEPKHLHCNSQGENWGGVGKWRKRKTV